MSKIRHDILLRIAKIINVLLITGAFSAGWFLHYASCGANANVTAQNIIILLLYMVLFVAFGRIYEGFDVSVKQIFEMAYSQSLAAFISDGFLFVVIWLIEGRFPRVLPMLLVFAGQFALALVWSIVAHEWYYAVFPPKKTAIIYDVRVDLQKLIGEYGLEKKYEVKFTMRAADCIENLSCLDDLQTVFISGVHSHDRNIILKYCMARGIEVLVIPRVGDVLMSGARHVHMFHLPMLRVSRNSATLEYLLVKRVMDIVLSAIALVLASPFMLIVAIAVKAYDGGPVIYSHIRLTKDGKEFPIYKFRSMRTDAEKDGVARLSTGEKDDRITPVGKIIRKLRLDELPQLVNILKGDLSIVGPRPERPEIAAQYCEEMPEFALRLQVKAGLTGYAQVYGKYNTTPYDKLQMDLMYIAHPSLLEDFKIIIATLKILFMAESTEGVEEGQTTAAEK